MNILVFLTGIVATAHAFKNYRMTPQALMRLAFEGNADQMLYSPSWEVWDDLPCQYFFN